MFPRQITRHEFVERPLTYTTINHDIEQIALECADVEMLLHSVHRRERLFSILALPKGRKRDAGAKSTAAARK